MRDLASRGVAQLVISSELPELIGMTDRIVVLHDGRVAGELPGGSSEEDDHDHGHREPAVNALAGRLPSPRHHGDRLPGAGGGRS